jgi:hypothetical protein
MSGQTQETVMRRHLVATVAAFGLSAMLGSGVYAQDANQDNNAQNDNNITNDLAPGLQDILPFPKLGPKAAQLDLGIDLTDVALTPQGVGTFFASLDPNAQRIMLTSCAHYLSTPNSAQATVTIQFCDLLIRG